MDYAWNTQNFTKMKTGFEQPCREDAPLPASPFVTHLLQERSLGQPSWQGALWSGKLDLQSSRSPPPKPSAHFRCLPGEGIAVGTMIRGVSGLWDVVQAVKGVAMTF